MVHGSGIARILIRQEHICHELGHSANIRLQGIDVARFNGIWVGDLTDYPFPRKITYLVILLDLHLREMFGGSLRLNTEKPLVIAAVNQQIDAWPSIGMLHHTDRPGRHGEQKYFSKNFT